MVKRLITGRTISSKEYEPAYIFVPVFKKISSYVSDIAIVKREKRQDAMTVLNDNTDKFAHSIFVDLNEGAQGDYLYLVYNKTNDVEKAYKNLVALNSTDAVANPAYKVNQSYWGENAESVGFDEAKKNYYFDNIVDYDYSVSQIDNDFRTSEANEEEGIVDLNSRAGGNYIYMMGTKMYDDISKGSPIVDIKIHAVDEISQIKRSNNSDLMRDTTGKVVNLNYKAGGKKVYVELIYERATIIDTIVNMLEDAIQSMTTSIKYRGVEVVNFVRDKIVMLFSKE